MAPMTWTVQCKDTPDAILLVLASRAHDPDDYIRTHSGFVAEVADQLAGYED